MGTSEAARGAESAIRVSLPPRPGEAVKLALRALELAARTSADNNREKAAGRREAASTIEVRVEKALSARLGAEGFAIRSESARRIAVMGASRDGAANGLFALARALRRQPPRDLFARRWDVEDRPRLERRGVWLLHFLPQYTHLTIDGFTLEDWKIYLEFLREQGANAVAILTTKCYCPGVPETERYRPFWETAREAMRCAQGLGIRFGVVFPQNLVPSEVWWREPDLRVDSWGYYGINLCPTVGRRRIREAHRAFIEFFADMDEFGYMFRDGGADCKCPRCKDNGGRIAAESLRMGQELLREAGSRARMTAFTWMVRGQEFDDLLAGMPPRVEVVDTTMPHPFFPSKRDPLDLAKEAGRRATDFLFVTDPEGGVETECSVFPCHKLQTVHDFIDRAANNGLDGVVGYRMAPPVRFIGDAAVLRWAWNPAAPTRRVVSEIADLAAAKPRHRAQLRRGIMALELFWADLDLDALREAEQCFAGAAASASLPQMRHTADGVGVLRVLAEKALAAESVPLSPKDKEAIYERLKVCPIYQGYTSDLAWVGKSLRTLLHPMIDIWADFLRQRRAAARK